MLFNVAQDSTRQLTDFYIWLSSEGRIVWITDETRSDRIGLDRSYREYFIVPNRTLQPYFSDVIVGSDGEPLIYVSYPAVDRRGNEAEFRGVVVAAIGLDALGSLVRQDQPSESPRSRVLLIDNGGTFLYAIQQSLIGKDIIDDREFIVNSGLLSQSQIDLMVGELERLVPGPNTIDFATSEGMNTLASEPVVIDGRKIWTVYVSTPHTFVSDVRILFDQQNYFSALMVIVIGILAMGIAFFVISSNKRLEYLVAVKTSDLSRAVASLEQSKAALEHVNGQLSAANDQLKGHDKLQKEFINVASHEMKTPTQAILFHSDILTRRPGNTESLEAIVRNAMRLQKLSNNILDVTRIEGQALKLSRELFDINELISAIVADYGAQARLDVKIVFAPTEPLIVEADRARTVQVMSNILSNALEFTRQGTITITVLRRDSEVQVSVSDTGPGIDSHVLPKLFSKFVTKSDKGTGLGLFIAKSIVEAHGGKIWAENGNGGATFHFTLPAGKGVKEMQFADASDGGTLA
jgi:signal transduction histidine kinase